MRTVAILVVLFLVLILAVGNSYPAFDEGMVSGEMMPVKYSSYWPPSSGRSYESFSDGKCPQNMASGLPWREHIGSAVACPWKWPFKTTIMLDGETWTCLDRGSRSGAADDVPLVDFLVEQAAYPHGELVEVRVRFAR